MYWYVFRMKVEPVYMVRVRERRVRGGEPGVGRGMARP